MFWLCVAHSRRTAILKSKFRSQMTIVTMRALTQFVICRIVLLCCCLAMESLGLKADCAGYTDVPCVQFVELMKFGEIVCVFCCSMTLNQLEVHSSVLRCCAVVVVLREAELQDVRALLSSIFHLMFLQYVTEYGTFRATHFCDKSRM